MKEIIEWSSRTSVSDLFSYMRKSDLLSLRKEMTRNMEKVMCLYFSRKNKKKYGECKRFLGHDV